MQYDLTKVHQANLEILKEIDRICRKYRIKYMLDAGTLLGAVRHKGFIPWDDDADVAFTRDQYEAFLKVVKRELPAHMELVMPWELGDGSVFFDFTARIIYKNSRMHEDNAMMQYYGGKLNHIWVDLFTIDELPQGKLAAQGTLFLHKAIYAMAMGHRYHLDYKKYSLFHKLAVGGMSTIGRLVPMKTLFWMQKKISLKDKKNRSKLRYYSNYQPDYLYVTLQKEWCDDVIDLEFEDTKLMASGHYDEVLTWIYGDYRQLPPPEKRVPAHSTIQVEIWDTEE